MNTFDKNILIKITSFTNFIKIYKCLYSLLSKMLINNIPVHAHVLCAL